MSIYFSALYSALMLIVIIYTLNLGLSFLSRMGFKQYQSNYKLLLPFALIGVVIHELSHLIVGLVFNHKISNLQLFSFKDKGTWSGFVEFEFNSRNFYHALGQYFIGVAPVIVALIIHYLAFSIVSPEIFQTIFTASMNLHLINISQLWSGLIEPYQIVAISNMIIIFVAFSALLFSSMSKLDIRMSLKGLVTLVLLTLISLSFVNLISTSLLNHIVFYLQFSNYVLIHSFLVSLPYFIVFILVGWAARKIRYVIR